jgi:thiol-disulfide isomerase/thioredoxin
MLVCVTTPTDESGSESTRLTAEASAHDAPAPPASARHRWLELVAFVLLLGGALVGAAYLGSARDAARLDGAAAFDVVRPQISEPAPDFTLTDLQGRRVRLQDFRGRVVLLNFWATWCAPCREEFPAMVALSRDLGDQGLVVAAVNFQEERELVAGFAQEFGVSFTVLLDPDGETARAYRVQALPTTVFVDRQGRLAGVALGYRAWHAGPARAWLRELLAARATSPTG